MLLLSCKQDGGFRMAINRELLSRIIVDRVDIIMNLTIVERQRQLTDEMPQIITCVRRAGKSYLLYQKMN